WALAVVLYELLTGTRPFSGSTVYEATSSILTDAPTPLPASIPAPLAAVVMRLLEKDRTRRYQTAEAVRAALELCRTAGRPMEARPPAARRSRAGAAIVAGAAVIALGIAAAV